MAVLMKDTLRVTSALRGHSLLNQEDLPSAMLVLTFQEELSTTLESVLSFVEMDSGFLKIQSAMTEMQGTTMDAVQSARLRKASSAKEAPLCLKTDAVPSSI